MKFLVSPTDNELAFALGKDAIISSLPEEKGADVLVYSKQGLMGIQRKAVPHDFISSITDGRMTRLTSLLAKNCPFRLLICEGKFRYFPDGHLVLSDRKSSRFTKGQIRGMLLDIKFVKGVDYDFTENLEDTARYIKTLAEFMNREKHLGLFVRPSAKGTWQTPTSRDIDLWLLQSFPGIGPTTAENIIQACGGKVPLGWTCTYKQLLSVRGLGRKRAGELWKYLGGDIPKVEPVQVVQAHEEASSQLEAMKRRLADA